MGVTFEDNGSAMVGNDDDSSADNDRIDGRRVGLAVAVLSETEASPDGGMLGVPRIAAALKRLMPQGA